MTGQTDARRRHAERVRLAFNCALSGALALGRPGSLAAQGVHYEGSLSVSTGTYIFAERTTTWALTTGVAANVGPITLRATLPTYLQNTTLVTASPFGTGGMPTGGSSSGAVADSSAERKRRHDGSGPMMSRAGTRVDVPSSSVTGMALALGDPMLSATVRALHGTRGQLTLGSVVKAPIADTATFGTGEWDVGVTAGASWLPSASVLLGADLAYWHLGDFGGLDLRNPVYGTASAGYLSRTGWGGSLMVSAGTAAIEGFDGPVSLGAATTRVNGSTAWSLVVTAGLTETTPDFTLGMTWRVQLLR